jgi:hypothetical protein
MSNPVFTVIVPAASAIIASLLTIFLVPWLQHHFWKYQRREELRLTVINDVNRLAAEFITKYIEAEGSGDHNFKPSVQFFQSLQVVTAQVKVLFSAQTFQDFKNLEAMIGPNLGPRSKQRGIDNFIQARDAALRSLYNEVGILPRKLQR